MGAAAYRDGEMIAFEDASVSCLDLGLFNGDSVYDVISVWRGRFFKLDEHLDRFERSATAWSLPIPRPRGEIEGILAAVVDRAGLEDAYVKVQLTRGRAAGHSRDPREACPELVALATPYRWIWGESRCRDGGALHVSSIERISSRAIDSSVKNYCRADFAQSQLEAFEHGCDDAVLLTPEGLLTEGIGWNIMLVEGDRVRSPARNVLPGVTRSAVQEICEESGVGFELCDLDRGRLDAADEVFASSTAGGVMPVITIDAARVGDGSPGPLTRRIQSEYWGRRDRGWHGTPVSSLAAAFTAR